MEVFFCRPSLPVFLLYPAISLKSSRSLAAAKRDGIGAKARSTQLNFGVIADSFNRHPLLKIEKKTTKKNVFKIEYK